jgi:hypothetical protein
MNDSKPDMTESLMKALQYSGLEKENLADIVKILIVLDVTPAKVFPIGLSPDGVVAQYLLNREQLGSFFESVIEAPRVQGFKVFPKGLDASTQFFTEVEIR